MAAGIAPVAVDAMGGDHAPAVVVQGAIDAARKGRPILLVGPEERIRAELQRQRASWSLPIQVKHAGEVVEMGDHPAQAMRRKRDNSIRVALELVRAGEASAMVSAGNSGAVMAGAIQVLGRAGAVQRPAIVSVLPAAKGNPLLLDVGANVECRPVHLVQFGLMGEVYARRVFGVARPRVAVLANGTEPTKGTALTRAAAAALALAPIRFQGHCEGRDLLTGDLDVVVTDGFTGNVALKTMEGTAVALGRYMRDALRGTVPSKIGALFVKTALLAVRRRVDWREVGGAPLVGVNGVVVIAHGASDARAVGNAIERARDAARADCTGQVAEAAATAEEWLAAAERESKGTSPRRRRAPLEA